MSREITIYHSPDADDAFMFYGLTSGQVTVPGYEFSHDLSDIESLNQRAITGELEVTAVSVHAYAHLGGRYVILECGASMGGADYGPCLVAKRHFSLDDGSVRTLAVPGAFTSASLALAIYLKQHNINAEIVNMSFDAVEAAVLAGEVDAGIIIHEGQLTHEQQGLQSILNLGKWWWDKHGLPLPLGVNVARKDLGDDTIAASARALLMSIDYSLKHRQEALSYALEFGRGITLAEADKFVGMYVNHLTMELGEIGRKSISLFLEEAAAIDLIPKQVTPQFHLVSR